ncbi:MAG: hypothetical protein EBT39_04915 [Sphingobacteriia bacterium]|nr:hypothetical protein [Candidatus Fonsibacter lacus]
MGSLWNLWRMKWFFKSTGDSSSNNIDFKRTSQNGDMTLNGHFVDLPPPITQIQPRETARGNNIRQFIRNRNIRQPRIRTGTVAGTVVGTAADNDTVLPNDGIRPPNDGIRPPDRVRAEILLPMAGNNINGIMDMVFNDAITLLQQMPNNEFTLIQHMNENNFNPIIFDINDNALLMDILDNHILDIMGTHRDNLIQTRQNTAREHTATANQAVANYLDLAAAPTNDAQNVHDHTVLAGFKLILERLKIEAGTIAPIEDIINEIKKKARMFSDNRPQLTMSALSVIDKMQEGEIITALEINGEPTTDLLCLQLVWSRANDPNNSEKQDVMKQAIFDNLLDCWENDILTGERKIVCVTGRATRMLSSLTLLDYDSQNWEVKKFEDFKQEIFKNVKKIIMDEATKASNSTNTDMQNAGRSYLATTREELENIPQVTEEAVANLNMQIKESISTMIDSYVADLETSFSTDIPQYMKNSVKKEAMSAVDMF